MAYPPQDMVGGANAWNSWNAQRRQQRRQPPPQQGYGGGQAPGYQSMYGPPAPMEQQRGPQLPQPQGDYNTWLAGQAQQRRGQQQYGAGQPSIYQTGAEQTQGPEARYRFGQSPGYRPDLSTSYTADEAGAEQQRRAQQARYQQEYADWEQQYGERYRAKQGRPADGPVTQDYIPPPPVDPSTVGRRPSFISPRQQYGAEQAPDLRIADRAVLPPPQTTQQIYQQTQTDLRTGQPVTSAAPVTSAPTQQKQTAVQQAITSPDQQRGMSYQQTAAPTTQQTQGGLPQPKSWDQFQSWVNVTYGKSFDTQDLLSVAGAVGLPKDPNIFASMTPEQWGQFERALSQMAQQRGMQPAMGLPLPTMPTTDIPTLDSSITGAEEIRRRMPYQYGTQVGNLAADVANVPTLDRFAPTTSPLEGAAQDATLRLLQSGPLVGEFTAPEAVGIGDRNRILQSILTNPDVFGAQQQQQLFEQQKEQQNTLAEQARQRLSQQMASRGLSARGGAELFGQAGIEENLLSGLLGAQRDIALQSAEKNRAARVQAIQTATETAQQDASRAESAYRTNLEGMQVARQAQERAIELGDRQAASQFARQEQMYRANLEAATTDIENQRRALEQLYEMQMGYSDQDRANIALAMQNEMARRQQEMDEYSRYFSNIFDYNKWLEDAAAQRRRLAMEEQQTLYNVSR